MELAIFGMSVRAASPGLLGCWALYPVPLLKAIKSELGVQAPAGFCHSMELYCDGDDWYVRRHCQAVLQRSRIAMPAIMSRIPRSCTPSWRTVAWLR